MKMIDPCITALRELVIRSCL